MPRIPILPTLVVAAAVALMIWLGFWQLRRLDEKESLLAHYAAAQTMTAEVSWPRDAAGQKDRLYRRARIDCVSAANRSSMAGRNANGESGMAQTAECTLADGSKALVVLGWSRLPMAGGDWSGGALHGVIAPGPRLVAAPPVAGLEANAIPDPSEIPNNHFAYAVQWFFFAATALVIYALALMKRGRK
ncbi:cytochrome oxidase assembly protein ShyY1 [Novosphingobium sp. PhB165]|uniref:SURF1 family cytochrome oxidase biogenesis protein n=1 Tax=Novosphingobium sp. PhB165 TaxID=2485105 RepID=UPI00104EF2C5|nr:SURF1 family protein [Novosphingobium sp. PhB165]TCM17289.1 cytochrome oxidase assembly protein ShyY1 [Novosphingobium sp. PhB165]